MALTPAQAEDAGFEAVLWQAESRLVREATVPLARVRRGPPERIGPRVRGAW